MITLVTGTPGAGKTLWVVREVMRKLGKTGRPIHHNITNFNPQIVHPDWEHVVQHDEDLAKKWMDLPPGSIIILDEVQFRWPASMTGQLPDYIARLDVHRKPGFDFFIVTQHPRLIAPAVRRFIGRHHHLVRPYGLDYSKVYSWEGCNEDPPQPVSNDLANTSRVKFERDLYKLFESAQVHTVKKTFPGKLAAICTVAAIFFGLGSYLLVSTARDFMGRNAPDLVQDDPSPTDQTETARPAIRLADCVPLVATAPPIARSGGRLVMIDPQARLHRVKKTVYACPNGVL